MKAHKHRPLGTLALVALVTLAAIQACGGDSNDNPTPPITTGGKNSTGASAGKSNTPGDGGSTAQGGNGTGNNGSTDGGTPSEAGSGNEGGGGTIPEPTCNLPELGEDGCFNCPQNGEAEQWLNRCVDSDCLPFPNTKERLPKLNDDGSLPDLPN